LERYVGPMVFGLFYGVCGMVGNLKRRAKNLNRWGSLEA